MKKRAGSQAKQQGQVNSDHSEAIIAMIQQIPAGHVATYGQIAALSGLPNNARQVGAIMRALPRNSGIRWFRVVNSKGEISHRGNHESENRQRFILENEGIVFDSYGRIELARFRWIP